MLWDCFVCGIRDVRVQWRLLAKAGLTFAKVFGLAQMSELVEKNVQDSEGTLFILCIRWSRLEGHHQGTVLVVSVSIRRQTVDVSVWFVTCVANKVIWLKFVTAMEVGATMALAVTDIRMTRVARRPWTGRRQRHMPCYNSSSSKSRMPLVQLLW